MVIQIIGLVTLCLSVHYLFGWAGILALGGVWFLCSTPKEE